MSLARPAPGDNAATPWRLARRERRPLRVIAKHDGPRKPPRRRHASNRASRAGDQDISRENNVRRDDLGRTGIETIRVTVPAGQRAGGRRADARADPVGVAVTLPTRIAGAEVSRLGAAAGNPIPEE